MICVDASVAAKWVITEDFSSQALALFEAAMERGQSVIAPPLLPFEVANILRRRILRHGWTLAAAVQAIDEFFAFPVALLAPSHLYRDAIAIADQFGLAASYDAHYVALAQSRGCELWTDDQKLLRQLSNKLPFVRWIGDYQGLPPTV